jgi:ELWxxDGT repeat protein
MAKFWRHRLVSIGALGVAACSLLAGFLPGAAGAEDARLVADLESGSLKRSSGRGLFVSLGAEAGHRFVFAADDERHGRELWVSDGTEAGTAVVLDLCPGRCASEPHDITRVGSRAFFFANDGTWPMALYVTDGTTQGTRRVHELAEAIPHWPLRAAAMGDLLVFDLQTRQGRKIYRSDGTRAGTRQVAERCPGCTDTLLSPVATSQGLFWRDGGKLIHLNRAGDTLREVGACSPCSAPPVVVGDSVLIVADGPGGLEQLVRVVDTQGATQVLRDFPGPTETYFSSFVHARGKLYFTAQRNSATKFYETDGTPQGTVEIDVPSLLEFSFTLIADLSPLADVPMLLVHNDDDGILHAFRPGIGFRQIAGNTYDAPNWIGHSSDTIFITDRLGRLYWTGDEMTLHEPSELFTAADPAAADLGDGRVALRLDDGSGFEPWRYENDGFARIRDIAVDGERSSNPQPFAVADGYLAVLDPQRSSTLPPLATNLHKVDDGATLALPWANGHFRAFAPGAGGLFLLEQTAANGLHFSDGAAPPASLGADLVTLDEGRRAGTAERLHFTTDHPGQDVWTSDGTAAGTREIHDPHPDFEPYCGPILCEPEPQVPLRILADETQAFWTGHDGDYFYQLWSVDPAGNTPRLVAGRHWQPVPLLVWAGTFYYLQWHDEEDDDEGVWRLAASNGQETHFIRDLTAPGPYFDTFGVQPRALATGLDDAIYFLIDGDRDTRLWRSDGTEAGTLVVGDAGAGAVAGELAAARAPAGARVYLALATPEHGSELWITDGSAGGLTRLDLRPGALGSHPTELRALEDGRLLFAADDGAHGQEPWISDGTLAGTRMLDDLGPGASSPGDWAVKGGRVLFAADAGTFGRELYALDLAPALPSCPADRLCLQDGRFEVEVAFLAPDGAGGLGRRALTSESSGVFTFFSPDNWELTVKVLDGCAINDRFWVFAAATTDVRYDLTVVDRATGATKTWRNPMGTLSVAVTDTGAFATCAAAPPAPRYGPPAEIPQAARLCPGDASALCLGQDQRFRVRVAWETEDGVEGTAEPVPYGSADSGLFTFFSADNWELMVKVLDGCAINQQHWLFAAGTTNVGWTLTLEDRQGLLPDRIYTNPVGTASAAIADVAAMACTP